MKLRVVFVTAFLLFCFNLFGQEYRFRQFGTAEGLNNSFLYSLNQDQEGLLWIGTAEGIYSYNGFEFNLYTDHDSLSDSFISNIYKDSSGTLWIGHVKGGITSLSESKTINPENQLTFNSPVTCITESDSGKIWFSTQKEGLQLLNPDRRISTIKAKLNAEIIFSFNHIAGNHFLAGTQDSLYILEYLPGLSEMHIKKNISNFPHSVVAQIIKETDRKYLIISRDEGIYMLDVNPETLTCDLKVINDNTDRSLDNAQGAILVKKNELWVYTNGNGIVKFNRSDEAANFLRSGYINSSNGLISNNVKSMFEDREGNIWLAMYGEGLLRLVDDDLKFYSYLSSLKSDNVYSVCADSDFYWIAGDKYIAEISQTGKLVKSVPFPVNLRGAKVNSIYKQARGLLYLGFDKKGVYSYNTQAGIFGHLALSGDDLENSVNHITGRGPTIWISTKKGVCKLNTESGIKRWFYTVDGLPHNNIQHIFIDSRGRALVGTICRSIYYIGSDNKVGKLQNSAFSTITTVTSFAEDNQGSIWAATSGNGLFRFRENNIVNLTRSSGLFSDFCYSLVFDKNQHMYVGHRGGFSQINTGSNHVKYFSHFDGIKSSSDFFPNSALTDNQHNIVLGTSDGIIKYLNSSKTDAPSPILNIDGVFVNKQKVSFCEVLKLKSGYYEIEVHYTGINLKNPEQVKYQTFLKGYSTDWSEMSAQRSVLYEKVGHGEYIFNLKSLNDNENQFEKQLTFTIIIKKQFYLTAWFYLILLIIMAVSLFIVIRKREEKYRRKQERLVKNLDEKTREIIVKEEIIKERKKVEKELIAAKEKAELSDRLKSSFLNNLSHEIRTPMNAIVGLSELLKSTSCNEEEKKEFIDLILSNSNSLLTLIDDIIDISMIESSQMKIKWKATNVSTILASLFTRYRKELREKEKSHIRLQLIPDLQDKELIINTDSVRLGQVLGKLLDNAIKFTETGFIKFGYELLDNGILFFVEDSGIGLSADKKEIIFELFRKVEESKLRLYRGTGLGLALSQQIVTLLGGEIKVSSTEGKGSRFYFVLPYERRAETHRQAQRSATVNRPKYNWQGKKILIVEDDTPNYLLLNEFLKPTEVMIFRAENGKEAVELSSSIDNLSLIIMDIKLPGIDGYEATRQIRLKNTEIPILAFTAYAMTGDNEKAIDAGCNDYLAKPADRTAILSMLFKYLG
jgi:signal transduction histidine kinase/ligand-binding sensor domain-containing protein